MTEQMPDMLSWIERTAPGLQVILLGGVLVALMLMLRELVRLRAAVFTFDNSVHLRLRQLQETADRQGPARYALASFIAAQRTSGRPADELRAEFEAMLGEFEQLEHAVEDVLQALDHSERASAGARGGVNGANGAQPPAGQERGADG